MYHQTVRPIHLASTVLLLIGLGLDVVSAFRGSRFRRGQGPSGFPVIPMVLYLVALLINPVWWGLTPLAWLFLLHILLQYAAPVLLSRWTR